MVVAAAFRPLTEELACWQAGGLRCRFWWRDDDVTGLTAELRRLHQTAARHVVSVLMAVIPRDMQPNLAGAVAGLYPCIWGQHGYAHENREPRGTAKSEFPDAREPQELFETLALGRDRLRACFGDRFFPVLVPPWNGFPPQLVQGLADLGFIGIAQYGSLARQRLGRLWRVDSHLDLVDWTCAPVFPPDRPAKLVSGLVDGLRQRRLDPELAGEPYGILTHHRAMDAAAWAFMDGLLALTRRFPCVDWVSPHDLFRG